LDPEIRFVVVGDGAERAGVEERAREAGVLGTSMFFLGHQPKAEAAKWVVASDMVVCLFTGPRVVWKDAVQNKFFDALAAGKPTASNFEGYQSIVAKEAGIGIILDPASASRGAEQLCVALRDRTWLAQVPGRAQQLATGKFSRDALAERLERVLDATRRRT
jgi:glycosyltransferase involved in cell wall biosynthesis